MFFCPDCGYDLQGIASDRCPECGIAIDRAASARSRIPWSHRGQIGRWRAYWRTVRMVMFQPKKLAAEIARPVSYGDAQLFRWVTVVGAAAPTLVVIGVWRLSADQWEIRRILERFAILKSYTGTDIGDLIIAMAACGLIATLVVLTGVQSYHFQPRRMTALEQNRAIALSYYPGAVISIMGLFLGCGLGIALAAPRLGGYLFSNNPPIVDRLILAAFGGAGLLLLDYMVLVVLLLRRTTRCGILRMTITVMNLVMWPAAIVAAIMLMPALSYWVKLIIGV